MSRVPTHESDVPVEARMIVASYRRDFPGGGASWYLTGSHADGSAIDVSDVDLLCLADPLNTDLYSWGRSVQETYDEKVDILMLHPASINQALNAHAIPMLGASLLIDGPDVLDGLPPLDMRAYKETVGWKFGRDVAFFHPTGQVAGPPDASQEFLGFVGPAKRWTGLDVWTHDVVVLVGKAATAMSATRDLVAGTRRQALCQLQTVPVLDKWSRYCAHTVHVLRDQWRYRVPVGREDRLILREVCDGLCDLENAVLDELEAAGIDPYRDNRLSRRPTK